MSLKAKAKPAKAVALTFRPRTGITDMSIDKIIAYCIPLCEYYHFITEKTGEQRHIHAALFLTQEQEIKYFNRFIKKKLLIPLISALDDGTILKHSYKGKGIYNPDWVANYCSKDDDTKIIKTYLPSDKAQLFPYYRDVVKKTCSDYVHFDFEKAYYEHYPDRKEASTNDIDVFLCYQMYQARTRKCIQEPRKVKNLIRSLYSYMSRAATYSFHSNVELHDVTAYNHVPSYSCNSCSENLADDYE